VATRSHYMKFGKVWGQHQMKVPGVRCQKHRVKMPRSEMTREALPWSNWQRRTLHFGCRHFPDVERVTGPFHFTGTRKTDTSRDSLVREDCLEKSREDCPCGTGQTWRVATAETREWVPKQSNGQIASIDKCLRDGSHRRSGKHARRTWLDPQRENKMEGGSDVGATRNHYMKFGKVRGQHQMKVPGVRCQKHRVKMPRSEMTREVLRWSSWQRRTLHFCCRYFPDQKILQVRNLGWNA